MNKADDNYEVRAIWVMLAVATIGLFMALMLAGCATLKAHPKISAALDCGKQGIVDSIPVIAKDVLRLLGGSSPNWSSLETLEASYGLEVVVCAVQALTGSSSMTAMSTNPMVIKNAGAYLHDRGAL